MIKETVSKIAKLISTYNDRGEEIPDPTPMSIPVGFKPPPTIQDMVAKLVKNELLRRGDADKLESFEEANDFGDEDEELDTVYKDEDELSSGRIIANDLERKSGFVEEIPSDKKTKAKEVLEKYKKKPLPEKASSKKNSEEAADSDEDEASNEGETH